METKNLELENGLQRRIKSWIIYAIFASNLQPLKLEYWSFEK